MRNSIRLSRPDARVALDHGVLYFDRATHRVNDTAELDDAAVAGALDDAAVMHGDRGIDQVAAQCPEPRQSAILVRSREPAITDHIRDQDRGDLAGFGHPCGTPALRRPSIRRSPIGLSN